MALVTTRFDEGIAVITLTSPPVNMGNTAVRRALLDAILEVGAAADNHDVRALVLASGLDDFYAGSDIREFDGPIREPELPTVIAALDDLEVPIVAALTGHTLGGGLEVALACDLRVASTTARLALPETTLGMLPGAGGTVRMARLVGPATAIDLVSSGRRVDAHEALALGLVDEIVEPARLAAAAIDRARSLPVKRRLVDVQPRAVDAGASDEVDAAVQRALRRGKARPNVREAVDLILRGLTQSGRVALSEERAAFQRLRGSDEAANLRYLFFATRTAARPLRVPEAPAPVTRVGVAGSGTMGLSIAVHCLRSGLEVVVFDADEAARRRAESVLAQEEGGPTRGSVADRIEGFVGCQLVIDAVYEDLEVKRDLFASLDAVMPADSFFASNSSYLDLDAITDVIASPERFAGLHFFNPADRNRLVEIVRTRTSADRTIATVAAVARRLGKTAIAARVGEGFVANRVYADYRGQAEFLLEDGALPDEVDRAMTNFGFAIGPFAVGDLSGLDIAWARRKRLATARDPRDRYVDIPDRLCELGRLGKKTGAGYYLYDEANPRGTLDRVTIDAIQAARAVKRIEPRQIDEGEIVQRILCAMVVAAAELVESGVAAAASDIDVALTEGFAFPSWRGGPVRYVALQPEAWIVEGLARVYRSNPFGNPGAAEADEGRVPDSIARVLASVAPAPQGGTGDDQRSVLTSPSAPTSAVTRA